MLGYTFTLGWSSATRASKPEDGAQLSCRGGLLEGTKPTHGGTAMTVSLAYVAPPNPDRVLVFDTKLRDCE
jgi:hypothetical protein